jgi:hypothetical protein
VKNDRQGGDDPELKKWAAKTLPNLERYLTIGAEAKKAFDPNESGDGVLSCRSSARRKKCGPLPEMLLR